MFSRRMLSIVAVAALAVTATACKGKDLTALKGSVLGLVDKYKPQVQAGLTTVEGLLTKAKGLPADTPGIGDIVSKLAGQGDNLKKLQGLLDGLPAQVETAVKAGKEEDLKKIAATVDADVGGGLKASDGVLAEAQKGVEAAEGEAKTAGVKAAAAALGEKLGGPLTAAMTKVEEGLTKAKSLPQDAAGVADLVKAFEVQKTAGTEAKAKLDGVGATVAGALEKKDVDGAQKAIDETTTQVGDITKKMEAELATLLAKLAELGGGAPAPAPAAAFEKALSTGFALKGNGNGIEASLVAFVEDAAKEIDKTTWFNFDRLNFATGSTKLDMDASKDQLNNMVEILKAFPNVKLKIGGYTDNDGAADVNKKISQQRAEAVMKALVEMGVAADRLEAEGYGPEHPVCEANNTPECKAQNRRIAVRVTAK